MEKTRGDLIQEIRNVSGQIDRSRDRLQRARNERESNAAERELDELRKIQRDRDDETKKLQELTAHARESIVESEARKTELQATLDGSLEGTMSTIGDLEKELTAKLSEREAVMKELPNMVGRRYERLHQRGKVPIASTSPDGTCLGCFVKLPPMMFHTMLSRTKFDECPQCHRIIYYTPPAPEGATEVTSEDMDAPPETDDAAAGEASS
jgi:predicted  nucleic acid-binding Zn-ribbon protein